MKKPKSFRLLIVLISLSVFAVGIASGSWLISKYYDYKLLKNVMSEIEENYVEGISEEELVKAGIEEILKKLDPYTVLYDPDNADQLDILIKGTYGGIGVEVKKIDSLYTVVEVDDNMPAQNSGVRVGDVIRAVNSACLTGHSQDETLKLIRGEAGSQVTVDFYRPVSQEVYKRTFEREVVNVRDVEFWTVDENRIGYINLKHFSQKAPDEFRKALDDIKNKGTKGLIVDLRGNSGGLLDSAVRIVDFFTEKGTLVTYTKGRRRAYSRDYRSDNDPILEDIPVVILIDGATASASEIVSGALQDLDEGVLLGTTSFGKGLVQTVINIEKDIFLKMTTAKYYTPKGRSIQKDGWLSDFLKDRNQDSVDSDHREKKGLEPDVHSVNQPDSFIAALIKEDILMKFAVEYLAKHPECNVDYIEDAEIIDSFLSYLKNIRYYPGSGGRSAINELKSIGRQRELPQSYFGLLDSLKRSIVPELNRELLSQKPLIYSIRKELARISSGHDDYYKWIERNDPDINLAKRYVSDKNLYSNTIKKRNRTELTRKRERN